MAEHTDISSTEALAWVDEQLAQASYRRTADPDIARQTVWSLVWRIETDNGPVYFKAASDSLRHEAAITQALPDWAERQVPRVLAADVARGWLLLADAGVILRTLLTQQPNPSGHLHALLPKYVQFQQAMAEHSHQLLALKAPDRRLTTLPSLYDGLIADEAMLTLGQTEHHEDSLSPEQVDRLHGLSPRFQELCDELAAFGIPQTLHHDDFHDGNIFVQDGQYIFMDWAECAVAHPFFSMNVFLRSANYRLDLEQHDLDALRDTYLSAWELDLSPADLMRAWDVSQVLATFCRALTWYAITKDLPPAIKAGEGMSVPGWLGEFLGAIHHLDEGA